MGGMTTILIHRNIKNSKKKLNDDEVNKISNTFFIIGLVLTLGLLLFILINK